MENLQEITLSNGTLLRLEDGMVACWDSDHARISLTRGQNDIVYKLARNLNHPLSMKQLYEAYSGDDASIDNKGISEKIHRMRNTLHPCIRDAIKSVRGYGYQLAGVLGSNINQENTSEFEGVNVDSETQFGRATELIGDYYGFYLDPLGKGSILGAYIHIENIGTRDKPQVTAYAIAGIRSKEVLLGNEIANIFNGPVTNYYNSYKNFKKELSDNDRRCSWFQGTLSSDGELATLHLSSVNSKKSWIIVLNVEEYMRCRRNREKDNDFYRGGLGLVLALKTVHGTISFRLGLVRKSFLNKTMSQNNNEMVNRLKLLDDSKDAMWKPLKLSKWLDKLWYEWIMNG